MAYLMHVLLTSRTYLAHILYVTMRQSLVTHAMFDNMLYACRQLEMVLLFLMYIAICCIACVHTMYVG